MKRCAVSVPLDAWVPSDSVVDFVRAFLLWFRDNGARGDRQKARVMWLLEEVGVEAARSAIAALMVVHHPPPPGGALARAVPHGGDDDRAGAPWPRRDVLGVYAQAQAGLNWVGACVPVGRLHAPDFESLAAAAEAFGDGTVRFTVDENVVFPNVPDAKVAAMLADPLFGPDKFPVPTPQSGISLATSLVSCTGAQFCGLALAETKLPALALVRRLDAELALAQPVRIHVTGCPNSCGQAQVGDIGLIGAPAKKVVDGGKKVGVPGFNIVLGGTVGEGARLAATEFEKAVPEDEVYDRLKALLVDRFGAVERAGGGGGGGGA
jgi:ferredoxin-nitrite reductase